MLASVKWINEYTDISEVNINDFSKEMTMTGTMVEKITNYSDINSGVVIGKIKEIKKHENSDKLSILKVDVGEELTIVTGATNVVDNAYVVVATVGAKLGDKEIVKSNLRGVDSEGMLCSYEELGFNKSVISKEDEVGVIILNGDYNVGDDFFKATDLDSSSVEFELTFNRPDCMSMMGLSYEAMATFDKEMKPFEKYDGEIGSSFNIKTDKSVCSTYLAIKLDNVNLRQSPDFIKHKLMLSGIRPINNVVDLTNYIMLETGNPMHAFDFDKLGSDIEVRRAENQKFTTLDDVQRELTPDDIVITSSGEVVAIAGVMGGKNTEVDENTKNILIEIANFDKDLIRATAKRLALISESSQRFQKGLDNSRALMAAKRVLDLQESFGINADFKGVSGVFTDDKEVTIDLRVDRVNSLLGTLLSSADIKEILEKLWIKCEGDDVISCTVPTFRGDLIKEVDLIEEVARIYGYNNIVSEPLVPVKAKELTSYYSFEYRLRDALWARGVSEMLNFSFVSKSSIEKLGIDSEKSFKLINPLGEEFSYMRPTLILNAIEILKKNERVNNRNVRLFEVGNIFSDKFDLNEKRMMSIACYDNIDFLSLKGLIEDVLEEAGIEKIKYKRSTNKYFHPGRSASMYVDNALIGEFGEISPFIKEEFGLKNTLYLAEIDLGEASKFYKDLSSYEVVSPYPSITLDISLMVPSGVTHEMIEYTIVSNGGKYLRNVELFDIYVGDDFDEGYRALAYKMEFNSKERTLTDDDILPMYDKIVLELNTSLNVNRRDQ